jgi:hypothetical protein
MLTVWELILVAVGSGVAVGGLLTLGFRRFFPGRLLSNDGGSPALRAITATYTLTVAFVLAVALQFFVGAQQQATAEADTVVALSNLARTLPSPVGPRLNNDLACYAFTTVYDEYPRMANGSFTPPDQDAPLRAMYQSLSSFEDTSSSPATNSIIGATYQQLGNLTNERDARIRAGHPALPTLVWALLIGGAIILLLAVAAVTRVDRPWPQFLALSGLATILAIVLILVLALERPFTDNGVSVSTGPMRAALVSLNHGNVPTCEF